MNQNNVGYLLALSREGSGSEAWDWWGGAVFVTSTRGFTFALG
jgi:hypothetical protein